MDDYICVSWNYSVDGWSREGCEYALTQNGLHKCTCNHTIDRGGGGTFAIFNLTIDLDDRDHNNCKICRKILKYTKYFATAIPMLSLVIAIVLFIVRNW